MDKRLGTHKTSKGRMVEFPEFYVSYHVSEKSYMQWISDEDDSIRGAFQSNQTALNRYEVGNTYPCWYDPDNVDSVILTRGYHTFSLIFVIIAAVIMVLQFQVILKKRNKTNPPSSEMK